MATTDETHNYFLECYRELAFSDKLHRMEDFEEGVYFLMSGKAVGTPCAFSKHLGFREGEITIWGGINGHGKSLITGQIALQLALAGESSAIMSFEMLPERTVLRMMRQYLGHEPRPEEFKGFCDVFNSKLVFLNHRGAINPEVVLGAAIASVNDYRCKHIFIDNLMKVVAAEDDYTGQKLFIQSCCDLAQALRCHIHIVHHVKKMKDESEEVGKFAFKGSGAIIDQADNAVLIHRNKLKEKKRNAGTLNEQDDFDDADSTLVVTKQRNGDWEGEIPLWFDPYSTAFCTSADRAPTWNLPVVNPMEKN